MIKNVIFDFNGTILDDLELTLKIEDRMLREHGLEPVSKDFYLHNFGFPVIDYYKLIGYDFEKNPYSELAVDFIEDYYRREAGETTLFPDVEDVLKALKEDGIKLFVLSASKQDYLDMQLKRLKIYELFDGVIGDNNIHANGKINYGNKYLEDHKVDRSVTVMIGDTVHDYEVAEALKLRPIMFTSGHNSADLFKNLDAKLVASYKDIYRIIKEENDGKN